MASASWSVEKWMDENRDVVNAALSAASLDACLVPERAFLAYALVEFDAQVQAEFDEYSCCSAYCDDPACSGETHVG